jgi:geranylgeranyl reductase family protein
MTTDADVIVVGAGPGGSAAAYRLAQTGLDVLLLEKTGFPREKVCGDGLTPRAVKSLVDLGVDTREDNGFIRNRGLRIIGGGMRLELPWPDLATYPDYGLVRPRMDLDELLARTAQKAGARLQEQTTVTGPVLDGEDRVVGVTAKVGPERTEVQLPGSVVIAADGSSARLALSLGIAKRDDRPMGVAVRRYFESPRHDDDMLESWLELRSDDGSLLPGYGWVFGVGDGTSNVGLGILNTTQAWQKTDYKELLARWTSGMPGSGSSTTSTPPARCAAGRCRWASTARRTTAAGCCWSATPAARSTRSTARASPTRWSPACWPRRSPHRRSPARPVRAGRRPCRATPSGCARSTAATTRSAGCSCTSSATRR